MMKAFVSSSSSNNHHHKTTTTTLKEREQTLATKIVLRLTPHGMTDHVYCQCQQCPFVLWCGYPIMRFVHPDHVQRLCAGLCEASKSGMAISIGDIRCCLPSSSSSCTPSTTTTTTTEPCYDTTVHLTVHETHSMYICVLYYYFNNNDDDDDILNSKKAIISKSNHIGHVNTTNHNKSVVMVLARKVMIVSLVLLRMMFHYGYYLFPVKFLLHNIMTLLLLSLRSKKNR